MFRRRDRNFTPFTIHQLRNSAGDEKHTRHIKQLFILCLQISPFETVILYSFWAIPPNKIGKHAPVKHFPNRSGKHARLTTDLNGKPPDKKPAISESLFFLRQRSFKFHFLWQNDCITTFPWPGCFKSTLGYVIHPQNIKNSSCVGKKCAFR